MMHFNKMLWRCATSPVFKYFFVGLIVAGCIWMVQDCAASSSADEFSKSFEAILQQFAMDDEEAKLAHQWDQYLIKVTGFDNRQYQTACRQLAVEYYKALIALGKCNRASSEKEKSYSSRWVDDLIKRFGKTYVTQHMDLIKLQLSRLYTDNMVTSCKELEKEAIYREHSCKAAFNTYLSIYIGFIDSLDEEQKHRLSKRKAAVEELMEIFSKGSIQDIIGDSELRASLLEIAVKSHANSDTALTDFFLHHPFFSKPFNLMKCLDDLRKKTGK
jgi:hypothetical protein